MAADRSALVTVIAVAVAVAVAVLAEVKVVEVDHGQETKGAELDGQVVVAAAMVVVIAVAMVAAAAAAAAVVAEAGAQKPTMAVVPMYACYIYIFFFVILLLFYLNGFGNVRVSDLPSSQGELLPAPLIIFFWVQATLQFCGFVKALGLLFFFLFFLKRNTENLFSEKDVLSVLLLETVPFLCVPVLREGCPVLLLENVPFLCVQTLLTDSFCHTDVCNTGCCSKVSFENPDCFVFLL